MNVYTTDRIRNVVLLGHGGCGKTSLVEAMAYLAGLTTRMGTVADKNTISDFDKEETKVFDPYFCGRDPVERQQN
jgi:elongation factor G